MDIERQKNFIYRFLFWLLSAGIVYCFLKYAMPVLTPFIIGFLVAVLLRPLAKWIAGAVKLSQKWTAVVILALFYTGMATLLILSGVRLVAWISSFVLAIPEYYRETMEPAIGRNLNIITTFFQELDPSLQSTVQSLTGNVISSLANLVTSFSTMLINWLTGFAGAFPLYVVNFIIAVMSSFYVSADYPGIKAFILKQVKPAQQRILQLIKENALSALGKYAKAYLILLSMMFAELLVGFTVIGIANAPLLALGISLFDALPILGTGGILIPWAVVDLFSGKVNQGIKLLILYAAVAIIRNAVEPRVVGQQIGLHPLVTLLCMYVGLSLFGVVGFLGFPLTATIVNSLNEKGVISLFKN